MPLLSVTNGSDQDSTFGRASALRSIPGWVTPKAVKALAVALSLGVQH